MSRSVFVRQFAAILLVAFASISPATADVLDDARKLLHAGKREAAVKLLTDAIAAAEARVEKSPDDSAAFYELARLHLELQHDELAAKAIDAALQVKPDEADYHALKALMHYYAGQAKNAEAEYQAAIRLDPKSPRYPHEYARLLASSDRLDDAERQLRNACALDAKFVAALEDLATLLLSRGRLDEAIALSVQAVEADPGKIASRDLLGQLYQDHDRHKPAYEQFAAIVKLDANNIRAEAKLLQLATALNQPDEAAQHMARVRELFKQGHATQPWFCREQFTAEKCRVMAAEYFELSGPKAVLYQFEVTPIDNTEKPYRVSLGSYELTNDVARAQGMIKGDERFYHLDYYQEREHLTYGFYNKQAPEYSVVRQAVVEILGGKRKAISGATMPDPVANENAGEE